MKNQKPKPWQLSLSLIQVVILLGLATGSMAGAFYLGFSTGQRVGYDSALHASQNTMARLPVPAEELDKSAADQVTSEVYAKLTGTDDREQSPPSGKSPGSITDKSQDIPSIGVIETTDTAPILPSAGDIPDLLPGAAPAAKATGAQTHPSNPVVQVAKSAKSLGGETLGEVLPSREVDAVKSPLDQATIVGVGDGVAPGGEVLPKGTLETAARHTASSH
ncbi:MAG: hypothetical protein EBZ48_13430 [Proteobacteria bacterium]|nr:hypothetical protein [Pseudomonadota bacterium]